MHRLLLLLVVALAAAFPAAAEAEIVVLRDGATPVRSQVAALEDEVGFDAEHRYSRALRGFSADLTAGQVAELRADPAVEEVVPTERVRTAAAVPVSDWSPPGVRRTTGLGMGTGREAATGAVAVVDTGIDTGHADLNVVGGTNCTSTQAANPTGDDDNGHGTHVAGTVAARANGNGSLGVAPGTRLLAVKVLDASGSGLSDDVLCGIEWILAKRAEYDIRVANFSLGSTGEPSTCATGLKHEIYCRLAAAGVGPVVAAGNGEPSAAGWRVGVDFAGDIEQQPAAFPEVLTVTATTDTDGVPGGAGKPPDCRDSGGDTDGRHADDADDRYASFSNFATTERDAAHTIAAPGVCIYSTWKDGKYATTSGTSMAAPHVAGAVALCMGEAGGTGPCTGLSTPQIIAKMRAGGAANGFEGLPDRAFGPLSQLVLPPPPPPPPPTPPPPPPPADDTVNPGGAGPVVEEPPPGRTVPVSPGTTTPRKPTTSTSPGGGSDGSTTAASTSPDAAPAVALASTPSVATFLRRGLTATVRCDRACSGSVSLRIAAATARRLGVSRTVARGRVRDGRAVLKLAAAARRKLRGVRSLKIDVVADVEQGGEATRTTTRVTLKGAGRTSAGGQLAPSVRRSAG